MALDNELERLSIAEEYLLEYPANSQEFDAALEHVRWVYKKKPEYAARCEEILKNVLFRRRDERHTLDKLAA